MRQLFKILESLPWMIGALVVASIFLLFAVGGILFVRKSISSHHFKAHHDVAGFVFTNLGVLYAVLLGFTVVNVQQRFDNIKNNVEIEAILLADIYRDVAVFSEKERDEIRQSIKAYVKNVVENEWGAGVSRDGNTGADKALKAIWAGMYNMNALTDTQKIWFQESIRKLNDLMSARMTRLLGSNESLSAEMWTLLLIGAGLVVGFIWFFTFESLTLHILMAGVLAVVTGFLLFLVYSLDTAFGGIIQVQPDSFISVYKTFD